MFPKAWLLTRVRETFYQLNMASRLGDIRSTEGLYQLLLGMLLARELPVDAFLYSALIRYA